MKDRRVPRPLSFVTSRAEALVREVCARHDLTTEDLETRAAVQRITACRVEAARSLRVMGLSYFEIAAAVGWRSHSAAVDACRDVRPAGGDDAARYADLLIRPQATSPKLQTPASEAAA